MEEEEERRGCYRPRAARYDCFAVILYWINGAGNNRARHNARMGRRPCRSGGLLGPWYRMLCGGGGSGNTLVGGRTR